MTTPIPGAVYPHNVKDGKGRDAPYALSDLTIPLGNKLGPVQAYSYDTDSVIFGPGGGSGVTFQQYLNSRSNWTDEDWIDNYKTDWNTANNFKGVPDIPGVPSITNNPVNNTVNSVEGVVSSAKSVGEFLGMLANPNTWARVAEFSVGFLLVGIGIYAVVKNTGAGRAAGGITKAAVPELGVASAAKSLRKSLSESGQYK